MFDGCTSFNMLIVLVLAGIGIRKIAIGANRNPEISKGLAKLIFRSLKK